LFAAAAIAMLLRHCIACHCCCLPRCPPADRLCAGLMTAFCCR
jgi:hypothetical protein